MPDDHRLSQISTMWSELAARHAGPPDEARAAAVAFVERYHGAVYGYLLTSVRDPDRAAELFQEFALRYLRGDFKNAAPARGRFRDYLRTVLINLIRKDHARVARAGAAALPEDVVAPADDPEGPADAVFLGHWREALLAAVWRGLADDEGRGGPPYHAALRARADRPGETSEALAAWLTAAFRPASPFTDAGVRKLLQRGREVFADRLVEEVARSIPTRDRERVAQELIDLGLLAVCKKALARWQS